MIKRIVDVSEAAYLHLKHKQLIIDIKDKTIGQMPIEDLGILILENSSIVLTQQVIIACQKNNTVIIFCDEKHLPYSTIFPIAEGHTLHNKIIKQQLNVTEPTRKRLWQQIVKQKIRQQAITLILLEKNASRLNHLMTKVKTGDSENCEAIAAQAYWKILFGNDFRRDVNLNGINRLLNYGYSIMRAMIARSICGAGLHPTLGLFHDNQYNSLCLADDLMEPFRPWIDWEVFQMAQEGQTEINKQSKRKLLSLLTETVLYNDKTMSLMVASHYLMADLKRCYNKERSNLVYPELEARMEM